MDSIKGRILCTEDDVDTRELLVFTLELAGYDVVCTDDAERAFDIVKKEQFDLYLLDNWMPKLSGMDLCGKIREFDTKTPILFYSGAAFDADKERALKAGAQGYLVKPVQPEVLIGEVSKLLLASRSGDGQLSSPRASSDAGVS
jgi:DNA-binding response OmpR family regulator